MCCSCIGAFLGFGMGSSWVRLVCLAMHTFSRGQVLHCGFRGVQMVAPSSIRAWFQSPG